MQEVLISLDMQSSDSLIKCMNEWELLYFLLLCIILLFMSFLPLGIEPVWCDAV